MKKSEFLTELKKYLYGLPEEEIKESLDYYAEIIDDRIEDGDDEESAVAGVGKPWLIASSIRSEKIKTKELDGSPKQKPVQKQKRKLSAWVIVLLALGSPIWLSLLIAAIAVLISAYAVMWSVMVALWSAVVALGAGGLAGLVLLLKYLILGEVGAGVAILGAGILSGGLAIFAFLGCLYATKAMAIASKHIFLWSISLFGGRRKAR